MKIKIATNAGLKEVDASPAFTMFGHEFFVHNDIAEELHGNFEYWGCTHAKTGRRLGSWYLSKEEAIEQSIRMLQEIGKSDFIDGIKRAHHANKKLGIEI